MDRITGFWEQESRGERTYPVCPKIWLFSLSGVRQKPGIEHHPVIAATLIARIIR